MSEKRAEYRVPKATPKPIKMPSLHPRCRESWKAFCTLDQRPSLAVLRDHPNAICKACHHKVMVVLLRRDVRDAKARRLGPGTCLGCGCVEDKACITFGQPCYWVDGERLVCSACLRIFKRLGVRELSKGKKSLWEVLTRAVFLKIFYYM